MKQAFKVFLPIFTTIIIVLSIYFSTSLGKTTQADIVTTLYPQYDIARQIVGDKLSVRLLTPFGSEVHSFNLGAKDIISIRQSKLFIYTSSKMERWAENIIDKSTNALDLSASYTLLPNENPNSVVDDLHYWTDPTTFMQLINVVRDEIIKLDPENSLYYSLNAQSYYNEVLQIHNDLVSFLATKNNPKVFFYGHNALTAFGSRYGIDIISLSSNYKPDAEPSPGQITELKDKIKTSGTTYLFVEELIDLKAPNSFKDALKSEGYPLTILELHGFHNISKQQNKEGVSYANLLENNFENLKKALS